MQFFESYAPTSSPIRLNSGVSGMQDENDRKTFTSAERRLIRNKLFHYMEKHGIGAPALSDRINDHRREDKISLKTLQRFLAGETRTFDGSVRSCHRFTEGLPSPDPIGALGNAMAEFYLSNDTDRYAGTYRLTVSYEMGGSRDCSNSILTITVDNRFCRVIEWSEGQKSLIGEGVLVCKRQTAIMTLQDKLTQAPKQFLLADDGEEISARGTEAEFEPSAAKRRHPPLLHFVSAKFTRIVKVKFVYAEIEITPDESSEERYRKMITDVLSRPALPRPDFEKNPLPRLTAISYQQPEDKPKSEQEHLDEKASQMSPEQSAFLRAAERGDETTVKRLLGSGADIDTADFETGLTALHLK